MKTFKEYIKSLSETEKVKVQRRTLQNSGKFYYGALYNSIPDATHNMTPDASSAPVGGTS